MPLVLTSSSITSQKKTNGVELYEYVPEKAPILSSKGRMSILLSTSGVDSDSSFFARGIFSHIKERYFHSDSGNPLEDLKNAVSEISGLVETSELLVCTFIDSKMFCVAANGARIVLIREGMYATLLRSRNGETACVSGHLKSGDLFIFGTRRFFEVVTEDMLRASVASRSPQSISDFLNPVVEVQNEDGIGAFIVKAEEKNEMVETEYENSRDLISDISSEESSISHLSPQTQNTLSETPLYIHRPLEDVTRKSKTPVIAGLVLVLILVGSILFGIREREKRMRESEFQEQINSLESKIDESVTLAHINPTRAREVFGQAQEEVLGITTDNEHQGKVDELKQKIKDVQEEVLGEKPVALALLVDLGLLSDGFSASKITTDNGIVYILDSEHKKIASVALSSKRAEIVAGPQIVDTTTEITAYVDTLYGFSNDGIYRLTPKQKVIGDDYLRALVSAYAGNIYVLDKSDSKIYRYAGGTEPKGEWLTEGTEADLDDASQMIIDGTLWVLKENGELKRFSNGNPVVFSLYGAVPPVIHPASFYTDEESENLYVLDPENARIVITTKGGEFLTQYVGDQVKDAKFIVVSEKEKKMFTVMEDKVYSMELGEIQ